MGAASSKTKKRIKHIIIANSIANDGINDFNKDCSFDFKVTEHQCNFDIPTIRWHKASPREDILKIQREAEIRDIEIIYENSSIKEKDLLNLMPDHYWSGKENKLPRYVLYRGDYPCRNWKKITNLKRIKSSSLIDLTESTSCYNNIDEYPHSDRHTSKYVYRSISCPYFKTFSISSLTSIDKDFPIKGILKNRKTNRPNSALIMDNRDDDYVSIENENGQLVTVTGTCLQTRAANGRLPGLSESSLPTTKTQNKSCFGKGFLCISSNDDDENVFSGYFDQSPTHTLDSSMLRVNANKKTLIKINLVKRLHLRPSSKELAHRNILHEQDEHERLNDFEQTRCLLNEKLSERPTLTELKKKKIIKFSDFVEIQETDNYDRSILQTCGRRTEIHKETVLSDRNDITEK